MILWFSLPTIIIILFQYTSHIQKSKNAIVQEGKHKGKSKIWTGMHCLGWNSTSIDHIFTARIWRMGKVMFSQVSARPQGVEGYPSPRFFPRSLVPGPFPGGGYPPLLETEQQSKYLLRGGQYVSCSQAGGLSCGVIFPAFPVVFFFGSVKRTVTRKPDGSRKPTIRQNIDFLLWWKYLYFT